MSTAKNDVTGDLLKSRASSESYRDNYDRIFGKKDAESAECNDGGSVGAEGVWELENSGIGE